MLICQHASDGALGLILNRPSVATVSEVLPMAGGESSLLSDPVWQGGPVGTESVLILHDGDTGGDPPVVPGVSFGGDSDLLRELLEKDSLGEKFQARLYVGYAGWGEGQLEFEVSTESWVMIPAESKHVFLNADQNLWMELMKGLGGSYAFAALAPDDPELN